MYLTHPFPPVNIVLEYVLIVLGSKDGLLRSWTCVLNGYFKDIENLYAQGRCLLN